MNLTNDNKGLKSTLGIQIQKWKIDFHVVALSIGCWKIYWLLYFNQILILLTGLVIPGLVIVVQASLDSRSAYTITTEPWVSKTVGLFICQSLSDFQISNSFEKLRSFWIQICKAFFSKSIFRGRKFDLKFGVIPKEINVYQKYSILR